MYVCMYIMYICMYVYILCIYIYIAMAGILCDDIMSKQKM